MNQTRRVDTAVTRGPRRWWRRDRPSPIEAPRPERMFEVGYFCSQQIASLGNKHQEAQVIEQLGVAFSERWRVIDEADQEYEFIDDRRK